MKTHRFRLAAVVGVVAALAVAIVAIAAANGDHGIREKLTGYQENPALSTTGHGKFQLSIDRKHQEIHYVLTYGGLESPATQSHIHFEKKTNNGNIVVFLCSNLGNGPAGTQGCPAAGGTVTDFHGDPLHTGPGLIAAATPEAHQRLLELVTPHVTAG